MRTAIILGADSEIAQGLIPLLRDDYSILSWTRGQEIVVGKWDLVISCIGTVAPVGLWYELEDFEFQRGIESNLLLPIRLLRSIWPWHNPDASVCLLAGSNPNMIMAGYSAYNTGKMALLKAVEQMDFETTDAKIFALGPGTILTKIHEPSKVWENPKLATAIAAGEDRAAKIARVYECLKWCIGMPKDIVGGRNICVSDPWGQTGERFAAWLEMHQDGAKLRRKECAH